MAGQERKDESEDEPLVEVDSAGVYFVSLEEFGGWWGNLNRDEN